jgi:hypothetical protein
MSKNSGVIYLLPIIVGFFLGCNISYNNDVYNYVPKGTLLSVELLKKSEQIIVIDTSLILMYNISNDFEKYDPHLLFFNKKRKLSSACYFPSEMVDSIKGQKIYCLLNDSRYKRRSEYRNDIPNGFVFSFNKNNEGEIYRSEREIDEITLDSVFSVTLYVRDKVSSLSEGNLPKNVMLRNLLPLKYPINRFLLNYQNGMLSIRKFEDGYLLTENLMFSDRAIIEKFYNQLYMNLLKQI